ncbi:MAG: flagellar FlbD family protein [Thermoleophilia bacterium]|nr:flagellar FlbD family protein [Thermoleophilia bacterium]
MITLHRLNGDEVTLNAELILSVEATPDTLISMVDRRRVMVAETVDEVVAAVLEYRRLITGATPATHLPAPA